MANYEQESFKYFAFISYNSKDTVWGKRLQRKLEHYRMPATMCSEHQWEQRTPIRPVFFAPTDIQPGGLSEELKHRLAASQHLIVICSPHSACSQWVGKEIEYFYQQGRPQNIHFFIVDGDPGSNDPLTGCFNPILRQLDLPEILGANIHEKIFRLPWMNRERAYIQLITKLLGVEFDVLWKRHRRLLIRQTLLGITAALMVIAAIILTIIMYKPVDVKVQLQETTPVNTCLPALHDANITITLNNETKSISIPNINAEGIVANIPANRIGQPARIQFECADYMPIDTTIKLTSPLTLPIARNADVYGHVRFTLYDRNTRPMPHTKVYIDDMEGITDANGKAEFHVPVAKQKTLYKVSSAVPLQDTLKDAPCGNTDAIFAL